MVLRREPTEEDNGIDRRTMKGLFPFWNRLDKCIAIMLIFTVVPLWANAQLNVHYLPHPQTTANSRTATHDSISVDLPFWDDFSTSSYFPDTALWAHSEDVTVQPGTGINPPSINVLTFDGADQFGNPHSSVATQVGEGDVLTSWFIDLSEADPSSTYLSFYFQKEGRGELPDQEDSLNLFLKGSDNEWKRVWAVSGNNDIDDSTFSYFSIPIDDPGYFFEYFQFRIVSHGKLSGPYDTWNVDYVYLDDDREGGKDDLVDHAVVTAPTSVFRRHTSVPYDHFVSNMALYLTDSTSLDISNLESLATNIETTVELRYQESDDLFALINSDKELPVNILPYEIRTVYSDQIMPGIFDDISDSLYLKLVVSLNTLDSLDPINLRVNDTISSNFHIHQDLAYDDGTAEYTAGLNGSGSQLAYRFYSPVEDQLTGLKIYFPKFSHQGTQAFILKVWDGLDNEDSGLKYSQEVVVQSPSTFNEFGFYPFLRPVAVSDTFYVGFEQTTDDFFLVGLDKNTNSGEDIFFNPDVLWEQNSLVKGSLMIRPVFGRAEDVITGLDPRYGPSFIVYPNPSEGVFVYEGEPHDFEVYDTFGRLIKKGVLKNGGQIDLSRQTSGVYLMRLKGENRETSIKLIKF